jgi:hypothetical protein
LAVTNLLALLQVRASTVMPANLKSGAHHSGVGASELDPLARRGASGWHPLGARALPRCGLTTHGTGVAIRSSVNGDIVAELVLGIFPSCTCPSHGLHLLAPLCVGPVLS